jgi:hypothetical protein
MIVEKDREYKEFPYFIIESLDTIRKLIKALSGMKSPEIDMGFLVNEIIKSNYAERMMRKFGKKTFREAIDQELEESYPFYDLNRNAIKSMLYPEEIKKPIEPERDVKILAKSIIESWYKAYSEMSP